MTKEDKRTVISSLAAAFALIVLVVAAPFGWLAVTSIAQSFVQSAAELE
jgi:hypothetical protein